MKTFSILFIGFILTISGHAQYRNIELQAAGLTCSMCSNSINKALSALPFVAGVKTNLQTNVFSISLKSGSVPDFDALAAKVKGAGFSVASLSVEANFSAQKVENDTHLKLGAKTLHFVGVKPAQLSGWTRVQLVDKGYLLAKQFSKYERLTSLTCMKTGYAQSCCTNSGMQPGERIFHVTL